MEIKKYKIIQYPQENHLASTLYKVKRKWEQWKGIKISKWLMWLFHVIANCGKQMV